MLRIALAAAACALGAAAAPAQTGGSLWHYQFQNGVGEYLTGQWESPTGGALNLSCRQDGTVAILAQIKGKAPPAGSLLRLSVSTRIGSSNLSFATDGQGVAQMPAASGPFRQLWSNLRGGDIVTLRYADGRTSVQSLAGASKTLPARPCG